MQFKTRPDTTDAKVIDEVIKRNVYEHKKFGFFIRDCPIWLDLGGNIGTFTWLASSKGSKVFSFEPEPENFELLVENTKDCKQVHVFQEGVVAGPDGTLDLYICKGDYNKYRHTIFKKRGRQSIQIKVRNFQKVLEEFRPSGIKIDIEGAEIELLESVEKWPDHVTHIVFEYSFDIDPSIARFKSIIDSLSKQFQVHHRKVDWTLEKWMYFPQAILVYCKR
jgi:FkbM family methyltransferase